MNVGKLGQTTRSTRKSVERGQTGNNVGTMYYYSTLRHFTILGQENAQNMPRYYTVKLCTALQNPGFAGFLAEGLPA